MGPAGLFGAQPVRAAVRTTNAERAGAQRAAVLTTNAERAGAQRAARAFDAAGGARAAAGVVEELLPTTVTN
jgi:hypothetical protein